MKTNQLKFLLLILLNCNPCHQAPLSELKRAGGFNGQLKVKECPVVSIMKDVDKEKLLGVWYAYATTPLANHSYQRRCAAYNVKRNTHFDTNILYTNYGPLLITYACDKKAGFYKIKLRILTRTRTPMADIVGSAINFLKAIDFPVETLEWLKNEAFCFEWYELKFETRPRPLKFQAPFNKPDY